MRSHNFRYETIRKYRHGWVILQHGRNSDGEEITKTINAPQKTRAAAVASLRGWIKAKRPGAFYSPKEANG